VFASVELFDDILEEIYGSRTDIKAISTLARVQMGRAVGVAIVVHGSMHPSMELLLRHALEKLELLDMRIVSEPGTLDDRDGFIVDLGQLQEQDEAMEEMFETEGHVGGRKTKKAKKMRPGELENPIGGGNTSSSFLRPCTCVVYALTDCVVISGMKSSGDSADDPSPRTFEKDTPMESPLTFDKEEGTQRRPKGEGGGGPKKLTTKLRRSIRPGAENSFDK
jgi:hypothetical protein